MCVCVCVWDRCVYMKIPIQQNQRDLNQFISDHWPNSMWTTWSFFPQRSDFFRNWLCSTKHCLCACVLCSNQINENRQKRWKKTQQIVKRNGINVLNTHTHTRTPMVREGNVYFWCSYAATNKTTITTVGKTVQNSSVSNKVIAFVSTKFEF